MDLEALKKSVAVNLRCVTQSSKGGVPLNSLQSDYKGLIGKPIPFTELGYQSLELFLRSIPEVVRLNKGKDGNFTVEGVADSSTAHIASLISRQKAKTTKKGNFKKASLSVKKYPQLGSWKSASSTADGNWRITASTSNPANLNAPVLKTKDTEVTTSTGSKLTTPNQNNDISQHSNIAKDCLLEEATSDSIMSYSSLSTENLSRPSTPFNTSLKTDNQQNIMPHIIEINIDSEELSSPFKLSIDTTMSKKQRKEIIKKALLKNTKKCYSPYFNKNQQKIFYKKVGEIHRLYEAEIVIQKYEENIAATMLPTENQVQDSFEILEVSPSIKKKQLKKITIINLKNLFLSKNNGVLLNKLQSAYRKMFGTNILYRELDYKSLEAFVQDIPDMINIKINKNGTKILQSVSNETASNTSSVFFNQCTVEEIPPPVDPLSAVPSVNEKELSCPADLPPPLAPFLLLPPFHQKEPSCSKNNAATMSLTENQIQDSCEILEVSPIVQKEQLKKFTMMNLKNLFLSNNEGVLLNKLQSVYKKMFGTNILYKDLDYISLEAFVQDIPDMLNIKINENGKKVVQSVSNETASNISSEFFNQCAVEEIPPPVDPFSAVPTFHLKEPSCSNITNTRVTNAVYKASLNSLPNIKYSVSSAKFSSLLMMNLLLFGDDSYMEILKRGVLAFDGFNFSEGSEQWNERETFFSTLPEDTLRECLKLLCIDCDIYNKKGLVQKLMQFLSSPGRAYSESNHH